MRALILAALLIVAAGAGYMLDANASSRHVTPLTVSLNDHIQWKLNCDDAHHPCDSFDSLRSNPKGDIHITGALNLTLREGSKEYNQVLPVLLESAPEEVKSLLLSAR